MNVNPDSLLRFPCRFPIKIMGDTQSSLLECIQACVAEHVPDQDSVDWVQRPSRGGNYLGVTITLTATSQSQLDALYLALGACPGVRMIL